MTYTHRTLQTICRIGAFVERRAFSIAAAAGIVTAALIGGAGDGPATTGPCYDSAGAFVGAVAEDRTTTAPCVMPDGTTLQTGAYVAH